MCTSNQRKMNMVRLKAKIDAKGSMKIQKTE